MVSETFALYFIPQATDFSENSVFSANGAFAAWYIPTAFALMKMDFKIQGFSVESIQSDYIDAALDLVIINNTIVPFTVNRLDMDVYLNDTFVSALSAKNVSVTGNGSGQARALLRLRKNETGAALWNIILQNNFTDSIFRFKGTARSFGRVYPFETELKISEIS